MTFKRKNIYFILLFFFIILVVSGCGIYSVRPGTIPPGIKSIAVEDVENETAEFGLGEKLTSALISRILSENLLPLTDPQTTHSVLRSRITRISDDPHIFDETETVKEYKITINIQFEWVNTSTENELMSGNLSQWSVYYSDNYNNQLSPGDQVVREDAMADVLQKISQDMIEKLTSDW
jgi:outer membrane lipopolysaccharide assembly protein LptE/RlpB